MTSSANTTTTTIAAEPQILRNALAGASFFLVATSSIVLSRDASDFALLWLANIATVGFCYRQPLGRQALVIAVCFISGMIANLITGAAIGATLVFMTANIVEIGIANLLIQWLSGRSDPQRNVADFVRLIAIVAFVPPAASGLSAIGLLSIAAMPHSSGFLWSWWIADAAGTATLLPAILLFSRSEAFSPSPRQALSYLLLFVCIIAITILAASYISHPFVYIGLAMMVVAMLCNPFWTAICAALVVVTISICAFESAFALLADGQGTIGNALHLHATVAVLPSICLSLVLQNLKLEKERVVEAADQFRRVMEDSAVGMALVTGNGGITKVNRAFAEMLGYPPHELERLRVADITHDDDLKLGVETLALIAAGKLDRFRFEKRYKRKDGSTFWALLAGSVIRSPEDRSYYTISQVENIDASKRYQAALEAMEERWQFAFSAANQGVWDANIVTGKTYYSPTWCSMLGYESEEIGDDGRQWLSLMHPGDREEALALDQCQIAGDSAYFEAQFRMRHKDGRWVWILDRGRVIERNAHGEALRMVGTHTDITHQKEIEEQILLLSERMKLAVEAGEVGLWHWNSETNDLWWDERMHALYGTTPATFTGTSATWSDRLHPEDWAETHKLLQNVMDHGARLDTEFRIITPDGEVRHIRALAKLTRNEKGGPKMLIGTNWDITDQKQLVEQLSQANQRLKEFTSFASHDLQAPLRHIRMQTELLEAELANEITPEVGKLIDTIASKSSYLQDLIRNLLTFAKATDDIVVGPTSLVHVVEDSIEAVLPELRQCDGRIACGELPDVEGDEMLLRQVFQNLFVNAIKYRSARPLIIEIKVERTETDAIVSIIDNGIGIDAKYKDYIFEVFRRIPSRNVVAGSGLGLSLCRRIVEAHNGELWLDASGSEGSVFKMRLPLART